jgi:hypothetical protein
MLKEPSNSVAATFATIPGRLTHDNVRMYRALDIRISFLNNAP